ncbi:MAG: PilZ domain-containing protein [Candidatus Latescibacterota bacterium]|nr:MAG: PilZ domain-containing protein [Candidatus Latescibacterota bacterium]
MQQQKVEKDARRERRVHARLQIELVMDNSTTSEQSSTINISANGVYFTSKRYLEPLTKLGLRLLLPGQDGGAQLETLDVRGVVVRTEPEMPADDVESYEIACFFTDTTAEFRERLGRYVQTNL